MKNVGRFSIAVSWVLALACGLPAVATDIDECDGWSLQQVRPGMSFEDIRERGFVRETGTEWCSVLTRAPAWANRDLDQRVCVRLEEAPGRGPAPSRVLAVSLEVPEIHLTGEQIKSALTERWGRPATLDELVRAGVKIRPDPGRSTLWYSRECDLVGQLTTRPTLLSLGDVPIEVDKSRVTLLAPPGTQGAGGQLTASAVLFGEPSDESVALARGNLTQNETTR